MHARNFPIAERDLISPYIQTGLFDAATAFSFSLLLRLGGVGPVDASVKTLAAFLDGLFLLGFLRILPGGTWSTRGSLDIGV